jgi:hypothetical protein
MPYFICVTCGTQYPETHEPPPQCAICEDERQYVNPNGQTWTTLESLQQTSHNVIAQAEPGLFRIRSEPKVALGQNALLVQTPGGNVLWDCITLLDDATVEKLTELGGVQAIAVSHPHYHSTIVEWSHRFDNAPIYIHEGNRGWVMRPDPAVTFWGGDTHPLVGGLTLICCGGHYDGSAVLHWPDGAEGRGVLLTGDTIDIVTDSRYMSFMYSYPNLIPLSASKVRRIVASVEPFDFDRMYEAFGAVTMHGAKTGLRYSADRYIRAITD